MSDVHLDFDNKKTSRLRKTKHSVPEKPCSLNRSAKLGNPSHIVQSPPIAANKKTCSSCIP